MISSPPDGVSDAQNLPGDTPDRPCAPRLALVLDSPPGRSMAWWTDPIWAIVVIVLPVFCFAAYLNQFNYSLYSASADFVTWQTFWLAMFSAAMLLLGVAIGRGLVRRQNLIVLVDPDRATKVLQWFGWIAIAAYVLLLGTLLYRIDLVLELLRGNAAASGLLREALGRIPGVTSLVQFGIVFLALLSALITLAGYRMSPRIRNISIAIIILTFLRSVLNSERLALLEILIATFMVPIAYRWRASALRNMAPFIGIFAVFLAFAAGEYFRSWQYYRLFYASYLDFVAQRFAGYFSTSINNGAGAYLMYGRDHPTPQITIGWISKFPGLRGFFPGEDESMMNQYLQKYATLEFNNPGGLFSAYLDYNFFVASLFMVALGVLIGSVHRSFQNRNLIGLMLYPAVFLGLTDLIRIVYIVDTRTLPIFLGTAIAFYALRPTQVPRDRFLAQVAHAAK